jgi:hypothetical protein
VQGSFFRDRYITEGVQGGAASMITGLASYQINNDQVFVQATDTEYTAISAQAFMQAFYPPNALNNNTASFIDPNSVLANGNYIEPPLNGYQYALIETVGEYDPFSIFLTGTTNCAYYDQSAILYYSSGDYNKTDGRTRTFYQALGHAVLTDVLPQSDWSYHNAFGIFDYVSYQYLHNSTAKSVLDGPAYRDPIAQLGALASQKQWELFADLTQSGVIMGDQIRAIAGRTLAARVLGLLMDNLGSSGTLSKFNLLVGDYQPMLSLFALMDLPHTNANFEFIPPFGSAMAFELFSWENGTGVSDGDGANYPSMDDLWVRFLYINGSMTDANPSPNIQAYPIFERGPSETDMRWIDFESFMMNIMLNNVADWCLDCGETSIFCTTFNENTTGTDGGSSSSKKSRVSPQVAGVIGAVVTLGVAGILFAIAALVFGVRVYRNNGRRSSSLGGFKGSKKLASDPDLSLPKNAAPVGIVAVDDDGLSKKGHERIGSWELGQKDVERNTFASLGGSTVASETHRKPSFEMDFDRDDINPLQQPTQVRESF